MKKIDRFYVSEFDKKMAQFNKTHTLSAAQSAEKQKYAVIYAQRDQANPESVASTATEDDNALWD